MTSRSRRTPRPAPSRSATRSSRGSSRRATCTRAPKQAWTPVAEFGAAGIDAVNFGPGDPPHAHTRDERVAAADLARGHAILDAFARS